MAFSHGYGQIPVEQYSIEAIRNGYEHGCTFFDTAEVYSPGLSGIEHNELIVGKALKDVRENVVMQQAQAAQCRLSPLPMVTTPATSTTLPAVTGWRATR